MAECGTHRKERLRLLAPGTGRVLRPERSGDPEGRPGGHRPGTDTDAPSWRSPSIHEEGSDPRSVRQPAYLLGISEDITERRRMEQERRLLAEVSVALSASLDYEKTL